MYSRRWFDKYYVHTHTSLFLDNSLAEMSDRLSSTFHCLHCTCSRFSFSHSKHRWPKRGLRTENWTFRPDLTTNKFPKIIFSRQNSMTSPMHPLFKVDSMAAPIYPIFCSTTYQARTPRQWNLCFRSGQTISKSLPTLLCLLNFDLFWFVLFRSRLFIYQLQIGNSVLLLISLSFYDIKLPVSGADKRGN